MTKERFSFYKDHPKTCRPDDFWGQVKRTVNGAAVSQDQINMIVDAVVAGLELSQEDTLLDLCCGNGALSTLFLKHCSGGLGVDFSEYLISIANQNFADPADQTYILKDVVEFCEHPMTPHRFSKAICYGSFPYIEHERAETLLCLLKSNFPNLERIFIGNCPDKKFLAEFYGERSFVHGIENDPDSPIGIWRTRGEFEQLAGNSGWKVKFSTMPAEFYASNYRYDVLLSR